MGSFRPPKTPIQTCSLPSSLPQPQPRRTSCQSISPKPTSPSHYSNIRHQISCSKDQLPEMSYYTSPTSTQTSPTSRKKSIQNDDLKKTVQNDDLKKSVRNDNPTMISTKLKNERVSRRSNKKKRGTNGEHFFLSMESIIIYLHAI